MILHDSSLVLFITIFAIFIVSSTAIHCNHVCGGNKLNYPFGFSAGCPIKLNCSGEAGASIGEFPVLNLTQNSILVNIPTKCDRPIRSIEPLFGSNYGVAWQNSFLLQNCSGSQSGCSMPTGFLENRFGLENCSHMSANISCYSHEKMVPEVLNFSDVSRRNCQFLFTTVAVDSSKNSLEFQSLELAWWLNGTCSDGCHTNATCVNVSLADGAKGFRCHCKDGFHGDGFINGGGCQRGLVSEPEDPEAVIFDKIEWMVILIGFGGGLVVGVVLGNEFVARKPYWFVKLFGSTKLWKRL